MKRGWSSPPRLSIYLPIHLSLPPSPFTTLSRQQSLGTKLRILLREDIMRGGKIIWTAAKFEGTTRSLVRKSERYGVSPCIRARLSGF